MTASDSTPAEGNESVESSGDWEVVGREMLASELQTSADEVAVALRQVAREIGDGEVPTEEDVDLMIEELRSAYWLVESVAEVAPDVEEELPEFQGEVDVEMSE